jgi:hypothetical protein
MYHADPDIAEAQRKLDEAREQRIKRYADARKEKLSLLIQLEAEERRQREEMQEEQMHQRLMRKLGARC